MTQEPSPHTEARVGPLDQPRDVGDDEGFLVSVLDHA